MMLAYSSIPDVNVKVSDADLKAYYRNTQDQYKQEKPSIGTSVSM